MSYKGLKMNKKHMAYHIVVIHLISHSHNLLAHRQDLASHFDT